MSLLAVNYHYFREESYAGGIYPTSRAALDQQIEALHQRGYRFIAQAELLEWVISGVLPAGKHCILTFDDGLKEQLAAFQHLKSRGIPAAFYVATHPIQYQTVLPTHQLHYVRTQYTDVDLYRFLEENSAIASYPFQMDLLENQYRYDEPVARKLKYYLNFVLPEEEKTPLIGRLFGALAPDAAAFSRHWYMDESDLRILAAAGALGSHGSAHLPLAAVEATVAAQDISESLQFLYSATGQPMHSFSYPFGGATAVNESLGSLMENAGIRFAFTMQRGENGPDQLKKPLFLRRIDTNDAPGGKHPLPIFS